MLLAIAAFHDYEIWQMDVKTVFLNENLEDDVYMTQPKGFINPKNARKVCKLERFIEASIQELGNSIWREGQRVLFCQMRIKDLVIQKN